MNDPILSRLCILLRGASPRHILIWQLGSTLARGAGFSSKNISSCAFITILSPGLGMELTRGPAKEKKEKNQKNHCDDISGLYFSNQIVHRHKMLCFYSDSAEDFNRHCIYQTTVDQERSF